MAVFSVWAPNAQSVEVDTSGTRTAMSRTEDGWWQVEIPEAGPGTDYAFRLDGGEPLPDPRSAWQPHGVHGPSRVVDHAAFRWTDKAWRAQPLNSGVIYELHVGTFTPEGTFDAAVGRLDHLVGLGVTHVELMPVVEFSGERGWGYDGVDLFAPHHAYGGPEGLKRFVDACHARDLAVVLDVVYNHFGPEGSYVGKFGPYFTARHKTPWGDAVNFDGPGSLEVRRFYLDNAHTWFREYHVDALRLDAIHVIVDTSARHILEELAEERDQWQAHLGRPLAIVAESDLNAPRVIRSLEAGGYGMDAQWADDFHHSLHTALTGESHGYYEDFRGLPDLAVAIRNGFLFTGQYSPHRDRYHGRPLQGIPGHRLVVYAQSHDHTGNRAQGERLSHLVSPGRLRIAAALLLTAPFVPMLFQGEEWGASTPFLYFTDHGDAELGKAVSEGRRREFAAFLAEGAEVPDPQAVETFAHAKLNWSEVHEPDHAALLQWHRDLIRLRRTSPDFTDGRLGRLQTDFDAEAGWLVMRRGSMLVACNFSDRPQAVPLDRYGPLEVLLSSDPAATVPEGPLPPESVVVARAGAAPARGDVGAALDGGPEQESKR